MAEIILHLVGDYITQTHWMSVNKTKSSWPAFVHALVYTLPFLLVGSPWACLFILVTHFFIDRFRLARYVVFLKNKATDFSLAWADANQTGYHKDVPAWLSVWLMIIADNTMHLLCNHLALTFL